MLGLFYFLRGFVTIRIEGMRLERFFNLCTKGNVSVWNIRQRTPKMVEADVSIKDFKRIRKIVFHSGVRVSLIRKKGLPFFLYKLKKRSALWIGIFFFSILLFWLSTLLWNVEIIGLNQAPVSQVEEILHACGVKKFARLSKIDLDQIEFLLMQDMPYFSWAGVSVKGTTLTVELKERREAPLLIPLDEPCNLVAAKDGYISALLVKEGETVVKVGDTARKGDLLVRAEVGSETEHPILVHAFGEVMARTWYTFSTEQKLYEEFRDWTGEKSTDYTLQCNKFFIKLWKKTTIPYAEYDKIEKKIGNAVAIHQTTYQEVSLRREPLTTDEALAAAQQKLEAQLRQTVGDQAEIKEAMQDFVFLDEETLQVRCTFECLENIAQQQPYEIQGEQTDDRTDDSN